MSELRIRLCEIDGGRFEDVIHALRVEDVCAKCSFFNPTIKDPMKGYRRCHVGGSCIAATLSKSVQSYMWRELGWIDHTQHLRNLGITDTSSPSPTEASHSGVKEDRKC